MVMTYKKEVIWDTIRRVILCLFILFIGYTLASKLLDLESFQVNLVKTGLFSTGEVWAISVFALVVELVSVVFLVARERLGVYLSILMMLSFTAYIVMLKLFGRYEVCGCGGILNGMSFYSHLLVNVVILILLFSIYLTYSNHHVETKRWRSVFLGLCPVALVALVVVFVYNRGIATNYRESIHRIILEDRKGISFLGYRAPEVFIAEQSSVSDSLYIHTEEENDKTMSYIYESGSDKLVWSGETPGINLPIVSFKDGVLVWLSNMSLYASNGGSSQPRKLCEDVLNATFVESQGILILSFDPHSQEAIFFMLRNYREVERVSSFKVTDRLLTSPQAALILDGEFKTTGSSITYTCFYTPNVYVYSCGTGSVRSVGTIDRVPVPMLAYANGLFVLKRGSAFKSNLFSFVKDGSLYVFSYRVGDYKTGFLLDVYSLNNSTYQGSLLLKDPKRLASNYKLEEVTVQGSLLEIKQEDGLRFVYSFQRGSEK